MQVKSDHKPISVSSAKADQPLPVNANHQLLIVKADHQSLQPIAVNGCLQSLDWTSGLDWWISI